MAALLARCVESVPAPEPVTVARLTVELLRPVPVAPLRVETETIRPGRRVQLIGATVLHGDTAVARATGLRIRVGSMEPTGRVAEAPAGPGAGVAPEFDDRWTAGYVTRAVDVRFITGSFDDLGPAVAWIRLRVPVVTGEEPSPLSRVAAAADFGNGVSNELSFRTHLFINPDLTIYLHRPPAGEWVCLDAVTALGDRGIGVAQSALWDERGPIGRSLQALLVEERR